MNDYIYEIASELYHLLKANKMTVSTAESCTGGMISSALTAVPGMSECYGYGVVTYANEAKEKMLGVKAETLESYGAVSEQTACEMALGAVKLSGADVAVSVTGIAGPGGGTDQKPVGLVYIGFADKTGKCVAYKNLFGGDRNSVREQTVITALKVLIENIKNLLKKEGR